MKNIVWWAIEIVLTIANLAVTFYISKVAIAIQRIFTLKTEAGWTVSQFITYIGIFAAIEIFIHAFCTIGRDSD